MFLEYCFINTNIGWATTMIGQPFDIIKVRIQSQSHTNPYYNGAIDCLKKLIKYEGVRALYKG